MNDSPPGQKLSIEERKHEIGLTITRFASAVFDAAVHDRPTDPNWVMPLTTQLDDRINEAMDAAIFRRARGMRERWLRAITVQLIARLRPPAASYPLRLCN
jgi:hypothetical protein